MAHEKDISLLIAKASLSPSGVVAPRAPTSNFIIAVQGVLGSVTPFIVVREFFGGGVATVGIDEQAGVGPTGEDLAPGYVLLPNYSANLASISYLNRAHLDLMSIIHDDTLQKLPAKLLKVRKYELSEEVDIHSRLLPLQAILIPITFSRRHTARTTHPQLPLNQIAHPHPLHLYLL